MDTRIRHRRIQVASVDTFYREAGREDAPVVLLPHGYPCSSYEFRNLLPRLADRWRLVAPDYPGAGYSEAPISLFLSASRASRSSARRSSTVPSWPLCSPAPMTAL